MHKKSSKIYIQILILTLTPPVSFLSPENVICFFLSAAYIQVHFKQDFFMEANNIYPNQIPREQSDLGPYCLQCRLPKNISRREMQKTKVLTGELRVNKHID